jgi:diketogulonate reductase-like aldo/keto reductase
LVLELGNQLQEKSDKLSLQQSAQGTDISFWNSIFKFFENRDCAPVYGNEKEIGDALHQLFAEGVVKREDLFITSKVFNNMHKERVRKSVEKTLNDLRLDSLDLLLVHWPIMFQDEEMPTPSRNRDGTPAAELVISYEYLDTWKEFEALYDAGKAKSIGVSNFEIEQLEDLLQHARIAPAVNQIEFHPLVPQPRLLQYCKEKGIAVTAYSPLGSGDSFVGKREDTPKLLKNEIVHKVAKEVNRSPAQVLLRWAIQKGLTVIPKTTSPQRLVENLSLFDFVLDEQQMNTLDSLDCNFRYGLGWMKGHYLP